MYSHSQTGFPSDSYSNTTSLDMQRIHAGRYPAHSHLTVRTEAPFFRTRLYPKERYGALCLLHLLSQMIYEMFKTKKRGMNEEFLRQNGPTCGLNAAAMRLAAEFTLLKARDSDGNQVQIEAIVGKLLDEAKGKNQTLFGEMYRSEILCDLINSALSKMEKKGECLSQRFHAATISLEDEEAFKKLLHFAHDNRAIILFPYLAGEKSVPSQFTLQGDEISLMQLADDCKVEESMIETIQKKEVVCKQLMHHAHWCVIKCDDPGKRLKILEGNGNLKSATLQQLWVSNQYLMDEMDFGGYKKGLMAFQKTLCIAQNRKDLSEDDQKSIQMNLTQVQGEIEILSKQTAKISATLKSVAIIIGRNSELYNQKVAATATAPSAAAAAAAEAGGEEEEK